VKVKVEKALERIVEVALYALVFIIPFSKAGIEIFAIIAIIGWLLMKIVTHRLQFKDYLPSTPFNNQIFFLFVISLISMFFSVNFALSAKGVFSKLGEYLLLFFIFADIFSERKAGKLRVEILLKLAIVSVVVLFIDSIFQLHTGNDFIRGFSLGQLRACFSNSNDFAGFLIAVIPVLFIATFFRCKDKKQIRFLFEKLFYAILFLTGLVLLGKTLSRGAYLGCIISLLFLFIILLYDMRKNKIMPSVILVIICVCLLIALGMLFAKPVMDRLVSIGAGFEASRERIWGWQEAFSIIGDFPVFGTGPNTYTEIIPKYSISKISGCYPHNCYLHIAAETGILGLLAFLLVLWKFFKQGFKVVLSRINDNEALLLLGVMAGVLATLVQSFFDTNLFALKLVTLFWVMLGIGTALIKRLSNK